MNNFIFCIIIATILFVRYKKNTPKDIQFTPKDCQSGRYALKLYPVPYNKKIEALKGVRHLLDCDLKVSKYVVDNAPIILQTNMSLWDAIECENNFSIIEVEVGIINAQTPSMDLKDGTCDFILGEVPTRSKIATNKKLQELFGYNLQDTMEIMKNTPKILVRNISFEQACHYKYSLLEDRIISNIVTHIPDLSEEELKKQKTEKSCKLVLETIPKEFELCAYETIQKLLNYDITTAKRIITESPHILLSNISYEEATEYKHKFAKAGLDTKIKLF